MQISSTISNYYEVTKPKIWYLLVFTTFCALIVASGPQIPLLTLALALIAVILGSASANTLTGYIDRDIDAMMNRTNRRPIPTGRISPPKALYYGLALATLSLVVSYALNPLSSLLMFLGIVDNVIIYSLILKRKNPSNIILGGFSGGAPALIGYAAVTNSISLVSVIMAMLVILWIPPHIWSLALHSKDDYARAEVPMLPVVVGERTSVRIIALTTASLVGFSVLPYLLWNGAEPGFGLIYLLISLPLGAIITIMSIQLLAQPNRERAWRLFKFSSPYLAIVFTAMVLDVFLS